MLWIDINKSCKVIQATNADVLLQRKILYYIIYIKGVKVFVRVNFVDMFQNFVKQVYCEQ